MKSLLLARPVHRRFSISSGFGPRIHPVTKEPGKHHNGYDFAVPIGTPIHAMHDGKIVIVGYENPHNHNQGFGLRVYQEIHTAKETILLVYAHLSEVVSYEGQHLGEYGLIGYSGNSGITSGPHLHVGARVKDTSTWLEIEFNDSNDYPPLIADIPKNKDSEVV